MGSKLEYFHIHSGILFTCISDHIIKGGPHGEVAILYKKSQSNVHFNISLIVISVYMSCDTYYAHITRLCRLY